jgi:hypothetical protein
LSYQSSASIPVTVNDTEPETAVLAPAKHHHQVAVDAERVIRPSSPDNGQLECGSRCTAKLLLVAMLGLASYVRDDPARLRAVRLAVPVRSVPDTSCSSSSEVILIIKQKASEAVTQPPGSFYGSGR